MALTQTQIIQSLGEALTWFQRELAWGVNASELKHLTGRIGELYAALITNGRMSEKSQQKGYDVVSSNGEKISVKTTTMTYGSGHVSFNPRTLEVVDRIIVLQIAIDDEDEAQDLQIKVLLDKPTPELLQILGSERNGKFDLALSKLLSKKPKIDVLRPAVEVKFKGFTVQEMETGTIVILKDRNSVIPLKPVLREIATELNIGLLNASGNPHNTRQLGSLVIKSIVEQASSNDSFP